MIIISFDVNIKLILSNQNHELKNVILLDILRLKCLWEIDFDKNIFSTSFEKLCKGYTCTKAKSKNWIGVHLHGTCTASCQKGGRQLRVISPFLTKWQNTLSHTLVLCKIFTVPHTCKNSPWKGLIEVFMFNTDKFVHIFRIFSNRLSGVDIPSARFCRVLWTRCQHVSIIFLSGDGLAKYFYNVGLMYEGRCHPGMCSSCLGKWCTITGHIGGHLI